MGRNVETAEGKTKGVEQGEANWRPTFVDRRQNTASPCCGALSPTPHNTEYQAGSHPNGTLSRPVGNVLVGREPTGCSIAILIL